MITEEQIKNLKRGDPITIRGEFWGKGRDGDILATCPIFFSTGIAHNLKSFHPDCCHLSSENLKYDPNRPFRKGDKVQVVKRNGRCYGGFGEFLLGEFCIVENNEEKNKDICITRKGFLFQINSAYLELITPVEEHTPYYIEEKDIEYQVRMRKSGMDCLIATFKFENGDEYPEQYGHMLPSMEQAKAAAEAECEHLNTEYRKEQSDD